MKQITQISVEEMKLEDISRVLEIEEQSFPSPWPRGAYVHELVENRLATYIVGRLAREIVGYAGMWVTMDEAHITTIAVDPRVRGQHVGERLLIGLIDAALLRGAHWMTLEVRRSNIVAQTLYKKYGFCEFGIKKGYYSDNGEDAIVMWTGNLLGRAFQERFKSLKIELDLPA